MRVSSVSFSGIYDIRFPKGTSSKLIDDKYETAQLMAKDVFPKGSYDVSIKDSFDITKSDKNLEQKGIRISTTIDNPWFLFALFDKIDPKLGQEYINQSKVELIFDTQA